MRITYFHSLPLVDRAPSGHVTLSLPLKRPTRADMAQLPLHMRRSYFRTVKNVTSGQDHFGLGLFQSRDFATSGQKTLIGRIWRNLRLRMRRTYFWTWSLPVTRLPVMSPLVMSLPVDPHCSPSNNNLSVRYKQFK